MDLALSFIATWISYILYQGTDSVLYQQALYVLGGGGVGIIGSYVFGAVWDYKVYVDGVKKDNDDDSDEDYGSYSRRYR